MFISVHPQNKGPFVNGYNQSHVDRDMLCEIITTRVWSHLLWAGGYREEFAFVGSYYAVFDIDEGMTKDEARHIFADYAYILGPTKSDGKTKWTPNHGNVKACDRFRVVVPWETPIWNAEVYRYNMKQVATTVGADTQAVDAARCWQPCKSILVDKRDGKSMHVFPVVPEEHTDKAVETKAEKARKHYASTKTLPVYVRQVLAGKVKRGDTNAKLFRACCFLFQNGFTYAEVTQLLERVPALAEHSHLQSTVKSAALKVGAV
jgi:hypothetical protein